jgi:murein DD-endopeptidase MepM/ murein hydrolase activator NlpD
MGGATGRVGEFGLTRVDSTGRAKAHNGLDLLCTVAWPVFAAHKGVIEVAGWENQGHHEQGYGQRVKVRGKEFRTVYAHLGSIEVKGGETVEEGQIIGIAGRSGNVGDNPAIPTHLHFEVQVVVGVDWQPIDPALWLMGKDA